MAFTSNEHKVAIARMLVAFRRRAAALFEPTIPDEFRPYKKGLYGVLYAKPRRNVGQLLAVERELLVLATSFTDLHARTNALAVEIIDGSEGRLERTVAIIVHRDPHGDAKLRNWGRDVGLTVIPLYMQGDDLPAGDELERRLLSEFFSRDPFDVTGPVSDDNEFYGRRDEAQELGRQLQQGQVRACLGIRKIGKTSLLHRVLGIVEAYHDCFAVFVDCSRDSVWKMSAGQLLGAIADAAPRACKSDDYCADVTSGEPRDIAVAYAQLTAALRNTGATTVLIFDEVDYITPGSPTNSQWVGDFNPFWRNLRAAYQELARSKSRLSVLISGVSSKWFAVESIDGVENAALAFIPEEYLAPMTSGACVAMIQNIGRTSGLVFDESSAAIIAEVCSYMPFWIRKAGSYVHRHTDIDSRPAPVSKEWVVLLMDSFVKTEGAPIADVALTHLFRVYPELRPVASSCVQGDASTHSPALRNTLHKYGIIKTPSAYPDIAGDMMRAGLDLALAAKSSTVRSTTPDTGLTAPSAEPLKFGSLNEWAEEIAAVGAQRNVIEKKLRSIVLNFLRFDVLQNRQRGTLSDRLMRVIDERRRARWQHLNTDDVIESFNWTDLIRLIEREWHLFSAIFADKTHLSTHASIINERYDAHAKDADRADLANYRRSLAWFEEALARAS